MSQLLWFEIDVKTKEKSLYFSKFSIKNLNNVEQLFEHSENIKYEVF